LSRAERLLGDAAPAVEGPLSVLAAVLRHQLGRFDVIEPAVAPPGPDRPPLLDLDGAVAPIVDELPAAVDALVQSVPAPLAEAGRQLQALELSESAAIVETWLDDPSLVDTRLGFWVRTAAAPVLERGAEIVTPPGEWSGAACPTCGGQPQASVIAEESGEFMAGSPRSLVCARCATWWSYPRVTCASCGEEDPRLIEAFLVEDRSWVRVDTCATCRGYVKTFDLREPGAVDVVPLVDDVTSLTLDVWAQQRGFSRPSPSLAGV
jgi:FdhE protein